MQTQKKILFFTGGSYVAGLEIVSLQLMKGLKERGYDVRCIINGWNDGDFKNRLTEIGIQYYEVKLGWLYLKKLSWTLDTLLHYPKAFRVCKQVIRDFRPDIVNFTNYTIPVMLYPLIKENSFYTLHDTHLPNLKHRLIYKLLNRKIGRFIAVSDHIATTLVNLSIPAAKITTVYNGIIPPVAQPLPIATASLQNKLVCFAIIGQIIPSKGHEVLINAVELLVKRGLSNFNVTIIGKDDNQYSKLLRALIIEKKLTAFFNWKGFVKNVDEIYKGIDVVVIPSLCIESFSLTTAEAMIRGLAAIASDKGGMKELIDAAENGLLFTQGDANALCDSMYQLMNDPGLIQRLGSKAQKKAMANFTNEVMINNYIKCYSNKL